MDADVAADKVKALKGIKDGPFRAMLKSIWLGTPCLGLVGLET
jgi:hypothetical protein